MPSAGHMVDRVSFQKRAIGTNDGYGNTEQVFLEQFRRFAEFIMKPGSEAALAARLEGRQPLTMIVRYDRDTREIDANWRAVDVRTGRIYAIHTAEDMDRKRQWITIVAEAGVTA